MAIHDDDLKKLFHDYNQSQLTERLSQDEIIKVKRLLVKLDGLIPKMEDSVRDHEFMKWIAKLVIYGIPILLALWQIIDRIHK